MIVNAYGNINQAKLFKEEKGFTYKEDGRIKRFGIFEDIRKLKSFGIGVFFYLDYFKSFGLLLFFMSLFMSC